MIRCAIVNNGMHLNLSIQTHAPMNQTCFIRMGELRQQFNQRNLKQLKLCQQKHRLLFLLLHRLRLQLNLQIRQQLNLNKLLRKK